MRSWEAGNIVERDGSVTFNNANAHAAVQFFRDGLGDWISPQCLSYQETETTASFEHENVVFMRQWPGARATLRNSGMLRLDQWNHTALPGLTADRSFACLGGWNLAVSRYAKNIDAAARFAHFMTNADSQIDYAVQSS